MTLAAAVTPFDSATLGWVLLLLAAASMLGVTARAAPLPRWAWWLLLAGALLYFRNDGLAARLGAKP